MKYWREDEPRKWKPFASLWQLRRRYVDTGGDCEHCQGGGRIFECPLCPAAVCMACARGLPTHFVEGSLRTTRLLSAPTWEEDC